MPDNENRNRAGHFRDSPSWENLYWWSNDGVRLHARDYPPADAAVGAGRPPILCLPGLTRNARDFEDVAARLAAASWRVIVVEFRGRGESGYTKDSNTYVPLTYVQDVEALLAGQQIDRFVAIGTSLGGIVTMLLAGAGHGKIAGAVLNDVGPEVAAEGLARIRGYVGKASSWPTWLHAARGLAESNADAYPGYEIGDWLKMAKRLYRLNSAGRIVLDYDMKIAEPLRVPGNEAGPDMWAALGRLKGVPVLIVRGERSDILAADVAARMLATLDRATLVTVPATGHAPTLEEPVAVQAIDALLAQLG